MAVDTWDVAGAQTLGANLNFVRSPQPRTLDSSSLTNSVGGKKEWQGKKWADPLMGLPHMDTDTHGHDTNSHSLSEFSCVKPVIDVG